MSIFVQLPPEDYSGAAFAAFDATHAGFELGDARAMMWMSQLAYETDTKSTIDTVGPRWAFESITPKTIPAAFMDTRLIIGERDDCTVIAFAGTDPALAANLITDANVTVSPANTHNGFQGALDKTWPEIKASARAARQPIYFTGHSLGAALAALAAFRAVAEGIGVKAVYTFGMPRVGLKEFADDYNAKLGDCTYRLVHGADIVPCIPDTLVSTLVGGLSGAPFLHVGRMLGCKSNGKFVRGAPLSDGDSNNPRFTEGVRQNFRNRMNAFFGGKLFGPAAPGVLGPLYAALPFAIRDHLPDRYINALAE